MEFFRQEDWSGLPCPSPGDIPNPGIKPRFPTLQVDSLPSELPGKPKNTGVGSLSFLQQIFPTQESPRGLLHCRRILYQLSHQGSPDIPVFIDGETAGYKENRHIKFTQQGSEPKSWDCRQRQRTRVFGILGPHCVLRRR